MSALEAYKNLQKAQSQQLGKECCSFHNHPEPEIRMNATSTFLKTEQSCSVCIYSILCCRRFLRVFLFICSVFQQCDHDVHPF